MSISLSRHPDPISWLVFLGQHRVVTVLYMCPAHDHSPTPSEWTKRLFGHMTLHSSANIDSVKRAQLGCLELFLWDFEEDPVFLRSRNFNI